MEECLFSIGLPVVKPDFLRQALNCCINQSYTNLEVIVLNNTKNEQTRKNVRQLVSEFNDARIKYFENNTQLPIIENWNKTIELSSGELYALLCDDDIWHKDFIMEIISLKNKYPNCKAFHTRVINIDENEYPLSKSPLCCEYENGIDFIWHRLKGYRTQYVSDFAANRKSLADLGGFVNLPGAWGSDDITWFSLASLNGIAYSSKSLCSYRISAINITSTMRIRDKLKANEIYIKKVHEMIKNNSSDSILQKDLLNSLYNLHYLKNKNQVLVYLKTIIPLSIISRTIIFVCFKPWHIIRYRYIKYMN